MSVLKFQTCRSVIKTKQFVLYGAEVAVCSEINRKHINTAWSESQFLGFKLAGPRNQ
jgi:hypothetical protein